MSSQVVNIQWKSKNFDKKVTQIRATEISSNHRELHGAIFYFLLSCSSGPTIAIWRIRESHCWCSVGRGNVTWAHKWPFHCLVKIPNPAGWGLLMDSNKISSSQLSWVLAVKFTDFVSCVGTLFWLEHRPVNLHTLPTIEDSDIGFVGEDIIRLMDSTVTF